jgi:hypothetical protein
MLNGSGHPARPNEFGWLHVQGQGRMSGQPDEMFRVVGVRANGERVVIYNGGSRETAERLLCLLGTGTEFRELLLESDHDGKSH